MTWEVILGALGLGLPVAGTIGAAGVKLHTRLSVVETKYEALMRTVDRIEEKVDNLPEDVVSAMKQGRK